MAFDDFEPQDASAQDGAEQSEDLFDFAAPPSQDGGDAQGQAVEAKSAAPRPAARVKQAQPDLELDEDLFGFPLMDGSEPEAADDPLGSPVPGELDEDVEQLIERASDLLEEENLESYIEPEPVAQANAPAFAEPATAPVNAAAPVADATAHQPQAVILPQGALAAPRANIRIGRTGVLLACLATTFAFALLGVVWNASRGMQEALSARNMTGGTDLALRARVIELEHSLIVQRQELLTAIEESTVEEEELLPVNVHVQPEWFVERTLIQEAIREGRYREARKRLFALQAVIDELDVEIRDELSPTVAFLIPETYRLQAGVKDGGL